MSGGFTPEAETFELARDLHGLLAAELVRHLKGQPSAELLQVARLFLAHSGEFGMAQSDKDRRALKRLHRLYLERLLEAVTDRSRPPAASMLAEVGHALRALGIETSSRGTERTIKALEHADLPFAITH